MPLVAADAAGLLPPDHPDLLAAKHNLAGTLYALGDLEGAHALFEHIHAARERLLPAGNPDLLLSQQNLAEMRYQLGDFDGALGLCRSIAAALPVALERALTTSPREARTTGLIAVQRLARAQFSTRCQGAAGTWRRASQVGLLADLRPTLRVPLRVGSPHAHRRREEFPRGVGWTCQQPREFLDSSHALESSGTRVGRFLSHGRVAHGRGLHSW